MAKPKIGLVTGLSGTGKTDLSNWMVRECGFLHFDGDIRDGNGIDFCNLRSEWNEFWERNDASRLAETLNARSLDAGSNLHYSRVSEFLLVQTPPSVCDAD